MIEESVKCLQLLLAVDKDNVKVLFAARQTELSSSCLLVIDNLLL